MILQWLVATLILVGSFFSVIAALGVVRMPDLYMRIQVSTKSTTLGVGSLALAVTLLLDTPGASTRAVLIIAFLLLTAPIAAHMIGRSAYSAGVALWRGTEVDELNEHAEHYQSDKILTQD